MKRLVDEIPETEPHTKAPTPASEPALDMADMLSPQGVASLQRLAGNQAVASLMRSRRLQAERGDPEQDLESGLLGLSDSTSVGLVARDPDDGGSETATAPAPAAADGQSATADAGLEPAEEDISPEAEASTTPAHPAPARPGFDLAGGQEILTGAFGSIKTIVPGSIQVLEPAAFQAAYDKIYGTGDYSWDKYVVPKYGSLNGFAYGGVNYINKASAGLHTIVHEMLHNNCAADFIGVVGSRFNEGATEVLTQVACAGFGVDAPVCYPGESPVVQAVLDAGLPLADLEQAYLVGGAQALIADWIQANCILGWPEFRALMETQNWAAAKAGLAPKAGAGDLAPGAMPGGESGAGSGSMTG